MQIQDKQPPAYPQRGHQRGCAGSNLDTALLYAEAGIAVFPCFEAGPRAKEPRTQHGHHDATTDIHCDPLLVEVWPSALVGVPAGPPSGVWVLDVDGAVWARKPT